MDAVHAGGLGGTYGGNPVACAAALAALETIEQDHLLGAPALSRTSLLPRLRALAGTLTTSSATSAGAAP